MLCDSLVRFYEGYTMSSWLENAKTMVAAGSPKSWDRLQTCTSIYGMRIAKIQMPRLVLYVTDSEDVIGSEFFTLEGPVELQAGRVYELGAVRFKFSDAGTCEDVVLHKIEALKSIAQAVRKLNGLEQESEHALAELLRREDAQTASWSLSELAQLLGVRRALILHPYCAGEWVEFAPYTPFDAVTTALRYRRTATAECMHELVAALKDRIEAGFENPVVRFTEHERPKKVAFKHDEMVYQDSKLVVDYAIYSYENGEIATVQVVPYHKGSRFCINAKAATVLDRPLQIIASRIEPICEVVVAAGERNCEDTTGPLLDHGRLAKLIASVCRTSLSDGVLVSGQYICKVMSHDAHELLKWINSNSRQLFAGVGPSVSSEHIC